MCTSVNFNVMCVCMCMCSVQADSEHERIHCSNNCKVKGVNHHCQTFIGEKILKVRQVMSHLKRTVITANMLLATDERLACVRVCVLTSVTFSVQMRVHTG